VAPNQLRVGPVSVTASNSGPGDRDGCRTSDCGASKPRGPSCAVCSCTTVSSTSCTTAREGGDMAHRRKIDREYVLECH
jgi:hypothetical protein